MLDSILVTLQGWLHVSYFFYLMTSPHKFISLRNYMISLGLLIAGIFTYSISVIVHAKKQDLFYSLYYIAVIYLSCGTLFTLLIMFNQDNPYSTLISQGPAALVSVLIIFITLIINTTSVHTVSALETLKYCSLMITIIFLLCFSLVNFSFVAICTIIICPIYSILGHPRPQSSLLGVLQILFIFMVNPICLVPYFQKFGDWENITWDHWRFSTLTFPFICLVYLPLNLTVMFIGLVSHQ